MEESNFSPEHELEHLVDSSVFLVPGGREDTWLTLRTRCRHVNEKMLKTWPAIWICPWDFKSCPCPKDMSRTSPTKQRSMDVPKKTCAQGQKIILFNAATQDVEYFHICKWKVSNVTFKNYQIFEENLGCGIARDKWIIWFSQTKLKTCQNKSIKMSHIICNKIRKMFFQMRLMIWSN